MGIPLFCVVHYLQAPSHQRRAPIHQRGSTLPLRSPSLALLSCSPSPKQDEVVGPIGVQEGQSPRKLGGGGSGPGVQFTGAIAGLQEGEICGAEWIWS